MKRMAWSLLLLMCGSLLSVSVAAQEKLTGNNEEGYPKEVYTGTIINTNGRMTSIGFTMTLTARTNDEEAGKYLNVLAREGQDDFLKAVHKNNLGFIAATGQTRRDLLVVREAMVDGKRRIIAAFERWQNFWEVRSGNRSLDYPFSIIEIYLDERGRGSGTFIGLAQVKIETDKKTEQLRLELENFGSFPSKVMGVTRRK